MKSTLKDSIYVIDNNSNSDSNFNNNIKLININLSCNKLSVQLLVNNSITNSKKRYIFQIEDKANKYFKAKIT